MSDPERHVTSVAMDAVASTLPGPAGWAVGVVGHAIDARARAWHARRVSLSLAAAEAVTGRGRHELEEQLAQRDDLVPLLARILHAAAMGGDDRILDAMGVALGQAIRDPARVPVERAFLNAVQDITEMHVQVLTVLAEPLPNGNPNQHWTRPKVAEAISDADEWLDLALGGLVSAGLAEQPNAMLGRDPSYGITAMGGLLLDVLRERIRTDGNNHRGH